MIASSKPSGPSSTNKVSGGSGGRAFANDDASIEIGIPGRTWYKHVVYAPGLWSGYGADTFPTLMEAIEAALGRRRSWSQVMSVEQHLADILQLVAKQLRGV